MSKNSRLYHKKRVTAKMIITTNINQIIVDLMKTGVETMTQEQIAKKYGLCTKTISRINVKYVLGKGDSEVKMPEIDPNEIFKRQELDALKRLELLNQDALAVLEFSFAAMKSMLESEISAQTKLQKGETCKTGDLKPREITDFFMAVAPFILPKKDAAKGKNNDKQGNVSNDIRQRWLDSQKNKPDKTA